MVKPALDKKAAATMTHRRAMVQAAVNEALAKRAVAEKAKKVEDLVTMDTVEDLSTMDAQKDLGILENAGNSIMEVAVDLGTLKATGITMM